MATHDGNDTPEKPALLESQVFKSADAQEVRNASGEVIAATEAKRTNASDGSLRRYSDEHLTAQEQSIELVYGDRTASRTDKKTERELLREIANKPENVNTQGLESIAKDGRLPEGKRALAGMIQEMRTQSKAFGTPTDALDDYAREALWAELLAKSQKQLAPQDDQEDCGSTFYPSAKTGLNIGSKKYAADQVIAQGSSQSQVVSDATTARVTDAVKETTLLRGYVSEPDAWEKVATLPEKKQGEVILTAIRAHAEHWGQEQVQRQIGALIGTTEGVGQIMQDMATITDFNHACLTGDKETAAKMGGEFGDSLGCMLVGGVNLLKISDEYLQDLGAQGDWAKPARDLAGLSQSLDQAWAELPPVEQERLKYRFVTEFAGDILVPAAGVKILKAAKFTEVLPNMAKIAVKTGEELEQLPGDTQKTINAIRSFCKDATAAEALTPEGLRVKAPLEAARPGQDNLLMMVGKRPDFVKNLDKLEDVWNIREKLGVANERNIAIAEVSIAGRKGKLVGISGLKSPEGTCPTPNKPVLGHIPKGFEERNDHSEFKILDQIAQSLDRSADGTVKLFTERYPCDSCEPALDQFRSLFPNIKLEIEYGLGKR